MCTKADLRSWTACDHLDELTASRLRQVRESERLIFSIVGQPSEKIGKTEVCLTLWERSAKVLFGTMDGDDAQYYNDQIAHFEQSSSSLTHLLKQQLTMVRFTLGAVNETVRRDV